eukprot:COSAG01_NODE_1968_length_8769_cov_5.768166_2_plen_135_part_00
MHPDRTLFLCYPGVDGMAEACLRRYRGPLLLYVGEGRYARCSPSSVARRSRPCPLPWVLLRALALAARSIQRRGLSCESVGGGDIRGGANATDGFFTTLELEWDVVQTIELDPFPECFERLYVLRRRDATKTGS